jgi:hypothetical protein
MKRAILLATAALLAMLILVPLVSAQDSTMMGKTTSFVGTTIYDYIITSGSPSPAPNIPSSGGPAILLPAAALLVGSGILTYAVLRRRQ